MKHSYILTGIFSFIFLSSLMAVDQRIEIVERLALENLRHSNVAYAMKIENEGAVLGVTSGSADEGKIDQTSNQTTTVLRLLQEEHMVVVEYTEAGAIIRAVEGKGMSDEERTSDKEWVFSVNENTPDTPADRTTVHPGDSVIWLYK